MLLVGAGLLRLVLRQLARRRVNDDIAEVVALDFGKQYAVNGRRRNLLLRSFHGAFCVAQIVRFIELPRLLAGREVK